jgi:hypothetical protein
MPVLMETILGRLGSRFCLRFHPRKRQLWASPLGDLYDRPLRLEVSLSADRTRLVWPFSPGEPIGDFEQWLTMTSYEIRGVCARLGVELSLAFTAPFYPQDERLSTAPFFYIDVACSPMTDAAGRTPGEIRIALLPREDERVERVNTDVMLRGDSRIRWDIPRDEIDAFSLQPAPGTLQLSPVRGKMTLKESTFSIPYSIDDGAETRVRFVLAAHCPGPVLDVYGTPHRFHYAGWFRSAEDVVAFAKEEEAHIEERTRFFDDLFLRSSLSRSHKNLIAYSFQSHLATTWWTEPASGDGTAWFGSWNDRACHNAMECEYLSSLLYLNLWPELLEKRLDQRAAIEKETDFLPVDCGRFLKIQSSRPRAAGTEEVCDYLLMLFALWRWWDRFDAVERNASLIRKLSGHLLHTNAANSKRRYEKETTNGSLTSKTLCALAAAEAMADELDDEELAEACAAACKDFREKLERREWSGHDALDGLLVHLMSDSSPDIDYRSITQGILSPSNDETSRTSPGPIRSAAGEPSVSRALWHDITSAYLGINRLGAAERYWESQVSVNTTGNGCCYADAPGHAALSCDPRGACTIGLLQAMLGLKLDRSEKTVCVSPLVIPAQAPLLPLVDWNGLSAPWVEVRGEGSSTAVEVSRRDLVEETGEFAMDPHPQLRLGNL